MPVTKEDDASKLDDKSADAPKKQSGPSLSKVVAALARNATFSQHQPEDAELVSDWLSKQEG
jgi:hypothetical protein